MDSHQSYLVLYMSKTTLIVEMCCNVYNISIIMFITFYLFLLFRFLLQIRPIFSVKKLQSEKDESSTCGHCLLFGGFAGNFRAQLC